MERWLIAFAFTQIVEVPIYLWALRGHNPSLAKRLGLAFGASAITHPVVWFVFPLLVPHYWVMVLCAEAFAVLAEAAWFAAFSLPRALAWAFAANGASVVLGFTSRWLFGVP